MTSTTSPKNNSSKSFKKELEAALSQRFDTLIAAAPNEAGQQLMQRAKTVSLRAGKRSRPELLLLTYQAYGGKNTGPLVQLGVALELLHQSFLLHDDITDSDNIRYDGPNVIGYYQADFTRQAGDIPTSMALLGGNIMFTAACQTVFLCNEISADKQAALIGLLYEVTINTNFGQQLDIFNILGIDSQFAGADSSLIATFKTAGYSIALPMLWAAELLNLPPSERKQIKDFATHFGITYQLIDDFSDYFSNKSAFDNHPKFRDFREGKLTPPLMYALEHTTPKDKTFLLSIAGHKDASDADVIRAVAILEACGARDHCQKQIEEIIAKTSAVLAKLQISAAGRAHFNELFARYHV